MARWLLMARDRNDGDDLTHEFLAIMLGVRQPGVTVALIFLEKQSLVRAQRGAISIIDREGPEEAANDATARRRRSFAASSISRPPQGIVRFDFLGR